ncbi:NADH:ubiquinone oxidoreductase subunit D [Bradyrhizobium sp. cir1]|uniref:hypothetical protein n=1 Tax=Bradyrhizobium sp. cir1 TaxID=1445730 RepID=UPI0016058CD9|nr:hypothetical protein [Bradyrhizobium sp. cir1]MBB4373267.1 NADH:ubiquinone oxidoreductase subunit D [Bradyrhizobium sp. cir1]
MLVAGFPQAKRDHLLAALVQYLHRRVRKQAAAQQWCADIGVIDRVCVIAAVVLFYLFVKEIYTIKPSPIAAATQAQPAK